MSQQSQPYAPGQTPVYTTYAYDALGRTTAITLPDNASKTQYTYQGNLTTVTDPAGNWKLYASDIFGNLATVIEPDPTANPVPGPPSPPPYPITSAPTNTLITSYTYDQLSHLTQVSMPRNTAGGMVTQTRTFVYDSITQRLTSATNPENGTVSYTYNADGTLLTKKDANNHTVTYGYDQYQRLTSISDPPQTFTYDTCPANTPGCTNAAGQLVEAQFGNSVGSNQLSFEYLYGYTPAGKVTSKTLVLQSANHHNGSEPPVDASAALTVSYNYDNQGALTQVTYPQSPPPTTVLTYTLDALERPVALTNQSNTSLVSSVTYNEANQVKTGTFNSVGETRTHNALHQLTQIQQANINMQYNYSPNQNNGRSHRAMTQ